MVAYSFRGRFVDLVASGAKRQTVRALGRKRHARVGERVQLYTAMRTRFARKIVKIDPLCDRVDEITMVIQLLTLPGVEVWVNGIPLKGKDLDDFAYADGFLNLADFARWWRTAHGEGVFEGVVVHWEHQP